MRINEAMQAAAHYAVTIRGEFTFTYRLLHHLYTQNVSSMKSGGSFSSSLDSQCLAHNRHSINISQLKNDACGHR